MRWIPLAISVMGTLIAAGMLAGIVPLPTWLQLPYWVVWIVAFLSAVVAVNELLGKPVPFLRWSFLRMFLGMKTLLSEWQVGDGREERVAQKVLNNARRGDVDDVIRTIDDFGYQDSFLINVGDRKGAILDEALERFRPRTILELGTYVGYSAIRMARKLQEEGHLYSVEFSEANADIARKIIDHAGLSDRVQVVVGTLGDGGRTLSYLETVCGLSVGTLDFVFIDHAKEAYLSDLQLILERGWLHHGSIVVADNIKFPGVPEYHAYMKEQEGKLWHSKEHKSHVEYQSIITDIVLESEYLRD